MISNPVRQKLRAGGTVFGTMAFDFFTPGLCPTLAAAGAEFVIFCMEHGGVSIDTIKEQVRYAKAAGIVPLARVPRCERHLVSTVLDAGVLGVMVPFMESRAQAEEFVSWCRYRPLGTRGLAFGFAHDDYEEGDVVKKMEAANEAILTIALIESAKGAQNAAEILSTPGIDLGWIGHFDLSNSLGLTAQFDHPTYQAAVNGIVAAAREANLPLGWLAGTTEAGKEGLARGFRALAIDNDVGLLRTALKNGIAALKS
jgi:2-keto-3-deoxy-L-rhamnonate aldolase RhmA